jgi:hypothetical protein
MFNTEFTRTFHQFLSWARPIQSTSPHTTSPRSIIILSTHLRLGLPSGLFSFPLVFPPIIYMSSSSPHSCYMPCPSHPPQLDYSNYTWRRVQITKLLVIYAVFSTLPSPHPSSVQISSSAPCSQTPSVRDQVSHPYRTTGKITVLYILIFKFFDSRREDRRFWTEW